jgi:hypothetical protein
VFSIFASPSQDCIILYATVPTTPLSFSPHKKKNVPPRVTVLFRERAVLSFRRASTTSSPRTAVSFLKTSSQKRTLSLCLCECPFIEQCLFVILQFQTPCCRSPCRYSQAAHHHFIFASYSASLFPLMSHPAYIFFVCGIPCPRATISISNRPVHDTVPEMCADQCRRRITARPLSIAVSTSLSHIVSTTCPIFDIDVCSAVSSSSLQRLDMRTTHRCHIPHNVSTQGVVCDMEWGRHHASPRRWHGGGAVSWRRVVDATSRCGKRHLVKTTVGGGGERKNVRTAAQNVRNILRRYREETTMASRHRRQRVLCRRRLWHRQQCNRLDGASSHPFRCFTRHVVSLHHSFALLVQYLLCRGLAQYST